MSKFKNVESVLKTMMITVKLFNYLVSNCIFNFKYFITSKTYKLSILILIILVMYIMRIVYKNG